MSDGNLTVKHGDVIEFTLRGERRTAEAMLVTDDGVVFSTSSTVSARAGAVCRCWRT